MLTYWDYCCGIYTDCATIQLNYKDKLVINLLLGIVILVVTFSFLFSVLLCFTALIADKPKQRNAQDNYRQVKWKMDDNFDILFVFWPLNWSILWSFLEWEGRLDSSVADWFGIGSLKCSTSLLWYLRLESKWLNDRVRKWHFYEIPYFKLIH